MGLQQNYYFHSMIMLTVFLDKLIIVWSLKCQK